MKVLKFDPEQIRDEVNFARSSPVKQRITCEEEVRRAKLVQNLNRTYEFDTMLQNVDPVNQEEEGNTKLQCSTEAFRKRHLYLLLFRMYEKMPVDYCLSNFSKVFNEVFIRERPAILTQFNLTQAMIGELEG